MIANVNLRPTALREFWSDAYPQSIYLWHGAKHGLPLSEIENDPVPTHDDLFHTQAQIQEGHDYCRSFYETVLPVLAQKLNRIHGVHLSDSFWRLAFGQWLYRHVVVAYDKFEMLKRFDSERVAVRLLAKECFFVPRDHYEYLLCFARDFGVQQLVSQYFYLYSASKFSTVNMRNDRQLIDFCNLAGPEEDNNPEVALLGVFLSGSVYNHLKTRSLGKIRNLAIPQEIRLSEEIDFYSRSSLLESAYDKSFESYFFQTLYYCLPQAYIEDFKGYFDAFARDLEYKRFRHLIVEAWISHIPSAIYAGLAKEQGRKVTCYEHGSGTVFYKNWPGTFVCPNAGDYFLSVGWGETRGRFIKGGFAARDIRPYDFTGHKRRILYIGRTKTPYQMEINEGCVVNSTFIKELRLASDFVNLLPPGLKESLVFRPRDKDIFFWDTEKTLGLGERGIKVDKSPDFAEAIQSAGIVVIDHISTGIAELLLMNAPFILLNSVSGIGCTEDLKSIFDDLRANRIIHETAESAVNHITDIYSNINGWWRSKNVQEALERVRRFSLAPASRFTDHLFSLLQEDEVRESASELV